MTELQLNPVFEVLWNGQRVGPAVARFTVESGRSGSADLAVLLFQDPEGAVVPRLSRGHRLQIRWGYQDDTELTLVFDGVIRKVTPKGLQTEVECLDYQCVLAAKRITQTWEHATCAEIAGDMLSGTGLSLHATGLDVELDRFPVHDQTVSQALHQLQQWMRQNTGVDRAYYVRAGLLVFEPAVETQVPAFTFVTGENIIDHRPGKLNLTALTTIAVPVYHSQTVLIDGSLYYVEGTAYHWTTGGRTVLQVRAC